MKKIAINGLLLALSIIMGYIESLIPVPFAVPGIKLGIANIVVLFVLYKMDILTAFVISILRVIFCGMLFSGIYGMMYSLAGALLSLIVMSLLKKVSSLNLITVSVMGAMAHILGQLIVAGVVVGFSPVKYYAPLLLIASFVSGIVVGVIAGEAVKRINLELIF